MRRWAVAVCAAALIGTILRHLFPENRLGQQGQSLITCLFLCVLLSPISSLFQDVKLPNFTRGNTVDSADLTARMRQQVVAQVNDTLLQMANRSLSVYGWSAKKVVTDMDIEEDGSISMGQIILYVDEEVARRGTAVRQIVEERLGAPVEVAIWEDNG